MGQIGTNGGQNNKYMAQDKLSQGQVNNREGLTFCKRQQEEAIGRKTERESMKLTRVTKNTARSTIQKHQFKVFHLALMRSTQLRG